MLRSSSQLVFAAALAASGLLVACVDDADSDDPDVGDTATGGAGGGTGGADGVPGEGGAAGGPGVVEGAPESCEELGGTAPDADYPGFDRTWLDLHDAPSGCVAEAEIGRTWTLHLTASQPTVRLSFADDILHANGQECTSPDGDPAEIMATTRIRVVGTSEAELVVVDLEGGTPAALGWTAATGLVLELGGGGDRLVVRGGAGADALAFSTTNDNTFIDFDGDGLPDALADGLASAVLALGPGDDSADGNTLAGAFMLPIAICGGAGNDQLRGGRAIDRLEGGEGDDLLIAGNDDGADLMSGGDGVDTADYGVRTEPLQLSLDDDADDGVEGEGDNILQDVERLIGGSGPDHMRGSSADNDIDGGAGDDDIDGMMGDDVLRGGAGDDTFSSATEGDGADFIEGGAGMDVMSYAGRTQGIIGTLCTADLSVEDCNPGACVCPADDGAPDEGDRIVNIEILHGTEGNDHLVGTVGDDVFYGYGGDDDMQGLEGNDSLYGDEGDDWLDGATGDDFLDGAFGDDLFDAGAGDGDICIVEPGEAPSACELF